MNKKSYQAPVIKKVQLKVTSSVLAACRTSTSYNRVGVTNCKNPANNCFGPG